MNISTGTNTAIFFTCLMVTSLLAMSAQGSTLATPTADGDEQIDSVQWVDPPGQDGDGPPGHDGDVPPGQDGDGPPGHDGDGPPGQDGDGPPGQDGDGPPGHDRGAASNVTAPDMDGSLPIEVILTVDERLASVDPDSSDAQASLEASRESLEAAASKYRHPHHADSQAAFEYIRDSQQSLEEVTANVEGDDAVEVEEASLLLYELTDESARLGTADAHDVVEAYDGEFDSPGQRQAAESALGNADDALNRADRTVQASSYNNISADDRVKSRYQATVHQRTAWQHSEKALDKVENSTAPELSVGHDQAFERNGTVLVPVEITLSDIRPYEYESAQITTTEDRTATASLHAPSAPDTEASGFALLDIGPDAHNQTATVTATADHDPDRTTEASLEIHIDEDDIVPERPARDEHNDIEIDHEETGVEIEVGGDGMYHDTVSVENVTGETSPDHVVSPTVRIANSTRADVDSATVTMPIESQADVSDREEDLRIFKWDPHIDDAWKPVETDIDVRNETATADVSSFSFFKVADEPAQQSLFTDTATPGWPALETFTDGADGWDTDGDVTVENEQLVVSSDPIPDDEDDNGAGGGGGGGGDPDPDTEFDIDIVSSPGTVDPDEEISIEFEIQNTGDAEESTTVTYDSGDFSCDGEAGEYTLEAGAAETGTVACTPSAPGTSVTITVSADGASASTTVDVRDSEDDPGDPGDPDEPDFEVTFTEDDPTVQRNSDTSLSYRVHNNQHETGAVSVNFNSGDLSCESSNQHTVEHFRPTSGSVSCSAPDSPGQDTVFASTGDDSDSVTVDIVHRPTSSATQTEQMVEDPTEASSAERTVDLTGVDSAEYELQYSGSVDGEDTAATITVHDDSVVHEQIDIDDTSGVTTTTGDIDPDGNLDISVETEGDAVVQVDHVSILEDQAGSGIPDIVEEMDLHMPVGLPDSHSTTPLNLDPVWADTSGDGLDDGEVVDIEYEITGTEIHAEVEGAIAHPARYDTANNGLSDGEELELGTNPFFADTSGDGLIDSVDESPLEKNTLPEIEYGPQFVEGADHHDLLGIRAMPTGDASEVSIDVEAEYPEIGDDVSTEPRLYNTEEKPDGERLEEYNLRDTENTYGYPQRVVVTVEDDNGNTILVDENLFTEETEVSAARAGASAAVFVGSTCLPRGRNCGHSLRS